MKPPLLCKNCGAPIRYEEEWNDYIHEARSDEPEEVYSCRFTKGYEHLTGGVYAEPEAEESSQPNTSAINELFS